MDIIQFGSMVHDTVTGFEGRVVSRLEYLNKCVRYLVQPEVDEKGQLPESATVDGPYLKVIAPPKEGLPPAVKTANTFELGVKVKDRLSGATGIAVVRAKHMYSGDRYGIQLPINKEGKIPDLVVFDEQDLEQIDPPPPKKKEKEEKPPQGPHGYRETMSR